MESQPSLPLPICHPATLTRPNWQAREATGYSARVSPSGAKREWRETEQVGR